MIKQMFFVCISILYNVYGKEVIRSDNSLPVSIDSRMGVTNRRADTVPWDSSWIGINPSVTVVINDNGNVVKQATGIGEFQLSIGRHELTYITYIGNVAQAECYSATVYTCNCALGLGDVPLVETKAARVSTCTEDGWTHEVKCGRCNAILVASTTLTKLGHVPVETKAAKAATCISEGWTHEVKCSRCNAILEVSAVIPALGGDHSGAITKPAVEPTSGTPGKTAEITCTRCGEVLQAQETIPALGYIRNLKARQIWPHRKIGLSYELAPDIADAATANCAISVKGTYGSTTKTATKFLGDTSCTPGLHHIVWDVEGDSITHSQSSMSFTVSYSSANANATCWVDLSSNVKNGMSINGWKKNVLWTPFANGEAQLMIDGNVVASSTNLGSFAWIPQTTGSHTLVHKSGSYTWTRTLKVTSLIWEMPPMPNPPTEADANISIGSSTKAFGVGGGSGSITTSGSGTWSATVSADWITIPSALSSRNAGLPVVYQVAANTDVEPRTGYVYVSGHVFTITQDGVGAELDGYSADFEMDGGNGSFTVLADAQSAWRVRSNADWISVTTDAGGGLNTAGTGEAAVYFTVAPWNEVATRSGTITAAGCTYTVNQTGRRMKISGANITSSVTGLTSDFDYLSHVLAVTINALAATEWDIELDGSWISIVDGGNGHGGGNVTLAVNENPSWLARCGSVRIGTETLAIRQEGRPSGELAFAISPEYAVAGVRGANGIISVTATPDLPWSAQSQVNWLTVMPSFQHGAGNGNVVYTASPNPSMANRTGTITVSAASDAALPVKTHTVSQPAATAMISADSHTFAATGESVDVEVTTDDIVNWTITEAVSWLSVVGTTSRIGPGKVTLVATENLTVNSREAVVTIAGHLFSVVQKGRSVEVEYESKVFDTVSDFATIDVHPDGNVQWTAISSDPSWITIWGGEGCTTDANGNVNGVGDGTIEYIVTDYVGDGTPRTGTITIGDKTVYVTQRAYDLSINPSAAKVGGNAGEGEVGVPATIGQVWNAIATEPWITVISGYDSGTGSGTVRFTYDDNDTGEERTGRIIISGETYTITQAARQMVTISARIEGGKGVVSGDGIYDRGMETVLTATAQDGYLFAGWTLPDGTTATSATLTIVADVDKELVANFRRIPVYSVNGESVREGTAKTFTAPADVIDEVGTTKLVCLGTSRYPGKGREFTLVVTEDIDFEWDLWTTNLLVTIEQPAGGTIRLGGAQSPATTIWVAAGSTIDLTATPESGKSFFRWTGDAADELNAARSASAPYQTSLMINAPVTIGAVFGAFSDTLSTALDAPALTFTTGGDAAWMPVIDASAQTGFTSARSGAIGKESEAWLDTTVEESGTLTFRWRVDCERDDGGGATWDRLSVWTNGVEAARIDGKTDWRTVVLPISGKTTIRWSFYRDDWDEPGQAHENCGWVDGIIWNVTGKEGN